MKLAGKLGEMPLSKQVATLAIWPLLENILTFLVGVTDIVLASHMATTEQKVAVLDAMGLAAYTNWFTHIFQSAVAVGVMALVSRSWGERNFSFARKSTGQALWLGLFAGLISCLSLLLLKDQIIRVIGLAPAAVPYAHTFLSISSFSGLFAGGMLSLNAAMRGSGDTRTPFIGMVIVNVVNMILSYNFVFAKAPLGGHGVAGIASGTVIGWACGFLYVVIVLYVRRHKHDEVLYWVRESFPFHLDTMRRILRVGLPQGWEMCNMWLIHAFGIRTIAHFPLQAALGAHVLAIRCESLSFMPGFAIATAASALTGQYLGAKNKEMAVKTVRYCWKLNVIVMSLLGICLVIFRVPLISLLAGESQEHVAIAAPLLIITAFSQPAFASCILLKTTMRGAGATALVLRWSFTIMFINRVLLMGTLAHFHLISIRGVWVIFGIDLLVQALVFAKLHFKGKWLETTV